MKKALLSLCLATAALSAAAQDQAPAFPGAEGFARYTTKGGRGGKVIHVTNLNDSGTGSLRAALTASGTRTIVFDVSGYIDLKSNINISKGNVTVAGQTAPGDGITVRYYTLQVSADNVIIRYLRFRRSQVKDVNDGADAIWGREHYNIILDHCSFSWAIDELASFYDNKNFTMQWCNLTEALANPGHSKGAHSYGGIWGGKGASFHHNFLAHMQNRVPRFNGARYEWTGGNTTEYKNPMQAERVDFRNCVMYNWGSGGCYGGPGGGYINMINNYYKAGPATSKGSVVTQVSVGSSGNADGHPTYWGYASRYCIQGNYVTAAGASAANYDWKGVKYDSGLKTYNNEQYIPDAKHYYGDNVTYQAIGGVDCVRLRYDEPIECGEVTTHAAEKAYEKILLYSGACLTRDAADERYAEEARTGTCKYTGTVTGQKGIIDFINDPTKTENPKLVSYPELKSVTRPADFDTDKDGMPDAWEDANGLDKNNPNDGNLYTLDSKGWYTNLEVYLNGIVEHITKAQNADALNAVNEYYPQQKLPSSVQNTQQSTSAIKTVEYFTTDGMRIAEPQPGINIRRITYADGTVNTTAVQK